MSYTRECSSPSLLMAFGVAKKIISIIQIVVPILLIVFAIVSFVNLVRDPEAKNGIKKVINKFLAAAIVFFVPLFVNVIINLLGANTNFSSCWTNADEFRFVSGSYTPINDRELKKIVSDVSGYESGNGGAGGSSSCGEKIARLAVELAGTASPEAYIKSPNGSNYCAFNKSSDPRLAKYNQVHDSRKSCNHAYASCTQATATVVDAAADPEINWMGPGAQQYYLQHSPKWKEVIKPAGSNWMDVLEPGDVGEMYNPSDKSGHSWIYVGNELARERFSNTDGYIYEGGYSTCKNPYIDNSSWLVSNNSSIHYYRFIGDCSEAERSNVKDGYGGPYAYSC